MTLTPCTVVELSSYYNSKCNILSNKLLAPSSETPSLAAGVSAQSRILRPSSALSSLTLHHLDFVLVDVGSGRNDIAGWCDLPGALALWNIFRRGFADEREHAPDLVLDHSRFGLRHRVSRRIKTRNRIWKSHRNEPTGCLLSRCMTRKQL